MLSLVPLLFTLLGAPRAITRPAACAMEPLLGTWVAQSLTSDGAPETDEEMLGSRLTFTADRLVVDTAARAHLGFALRLEPGARPCAFHLTPLEGTREPPGWMLFEVAGGVLKLGFSDNLGRRPASFEDGPNMHVLLLTR